MQVGFSGSRRGPATPHQLHSTEQTLSGLVAASRTDPPRGERPIFRHGDCLGWDAVAHELACALGFAIITHPPENPSVRAFKPSLVIMPVKPYLERNRDIVDASDRMIICPDSPHYRVKSGTWYTWKYARECGCSIILILPDGRVVHEVSTKPGA